MNSKVFAVIALLGTSLCDGKVAITEKGRKALQEAPKTGYKARDLCVFENDDNHWCFKGLSPVMRVGWDFEQVFGTDTYTDTEIDYYRLEYVPYIDVQLFIESVYSIKKLFTNELSVEVPDFRLNYFLSLILTDENKYCYGAGWENEEIGVEVLSTTTMQDCYKKIIISLCDRSATWSGIDAKWL